MFGRRATRAAAPAHARTNGMGYHTETIVVADPDVANIQRQRALAHQIGVGLQGFSGTVINYDQGAPERSLTGPVGRPVQASPTDAINDVLQASDARRLTGVPQYADVPSSTVDDDPYMSLAWARIGR